MGSIQACTRYKGISSRWVRRHSHHIHRRSKNERTGSLAEALVSKSFIYLSPVYLHTDDAGRGGTDGGREPARVVDAVEDDVNAAKAMLLQ